MQELKDASVEREDTFLTAEAMRDLTLTTEELFEMAKENITNSIMESMVGVATKNGQMFYATNILSAMDTKLRDEVMQRFTDLGYKVSLSKELNHKESGQAYKVLSVSWAPSKADKGGDEPATDGPF